MPKHLVLFHVITSALFIDYEQCMYTVKCTLKIVQRHLCTMYVQSVYCVNISSW